MGDILLSVSNSHVFYKGRPPVPASQVHKPFFWAFAPQGKDTKALRRSVLQRHAAAAEGERGSSDSDPLTGIDSLGPVESVESFWRGSTTREAFRVFTRHPGLVPRVSDALFDKGAFTAEHDVPYQQRLAVDLAAGGHWPFATGGERTSLTTLVFDIETTQFGNEGTRGNDNLPIDILGYAAFDFEYRASVDLDKEEFDLDIVRAPQDWQRYQRVFASSVQSEIDFVADPESCDIVQEVARNEDEELQMLLRFARLVPKVDVTTGHNIMGFDNLKIHDRLKGLYESGKRKGTLSREDERTVAGFLDTWIWKDKTYQFGRPDDMAILHPASLDTLLAARRFYFYRDDFTLKAMAPFLGIDIEERAYVEAQALDIDKEETLRYHTHDIQEQLGLSMHFMLQAVPLAFSTGMTFEQLFQGMNTKMWDHIGLIRAAHRKRLMPATCRAQAIAGSVQRRVGAGATKDDIVRYCKRLGAEERSSQGARELLRVAKYGDEMPEWVEYPQLIADVRETTEDPNGYAIAGGMTLHPGDLGSHFVPWWYVVAADVGAMYPTILKALNVGADTVQVAKSDETPDAWIWLKRATAEFTDPGLYAVRAPGAQEAYADHGVMIGIKKRNDPGVVNLGMSAILGMITKTKRALADAKKPGSGKGTEDIKRLQLNYQSLKAARNAGTHGILVAVNVSCRQFNLLAGAHITTEGQRILHESLQDLRKRQIRVVYGDSITGDRCVVVRDPAKRVRVVPIESLFKRVGGHLHREDGKQVAAGKGWQALAADADGTSSWRPITQVIRHRADKPVVRVQQKDGETVCTTDHSLMLRAGDRIVRGVPERALDLPLVRVPVPRNEAMTTIDLLEWIGPLARKLEESVPGNRLYKDQRQTLRFRHDDEWIWFDLHTRPDLGRLRLKRHVHIGTQESLALCRLLGAYVAEGSVTWKGSRRGASIATGDTEWLDELRGDFQLLFEGMRTSIIKSSHGERPVLLKDGSSRTYLDKTHKLQMTNILASVFFWALGGRGSDGKKVPDFIFNLPSALQRAFLESAVKGDGSHRWGARYTQAYQDRNFAYTTKSLRLASGLCVLLGQLGIDYGVRRREDKGTYAIKTRESRRAPLHGRVTPVPHAGFVYDLEVETDHTFVDALGSILLHNTDGIYLACGRNGANIPEVAKVYDAEKAANPADWMTTPDDAIKAVDALNKRFRTELNYPDFELEPEIHDNMVFVVHKNYLIFDANDGKLKMETKGNNFKGSDKADLARDQLAIIMHKALGENLVWKDEEAARKGLQASIKKATLEQVQKLRLATVGIDDLTLLQTVRPSRAYKEKGSVFAKRSDALDELLRNSGREGLRSARKFRFVVGNRPLPGLESPTKKKPGIKPIEFMWPVEILEMKEWRDKGYRIDLDWYKEMLENYVKGAFGFDDLSTVEQKGLDAWL